MPRLRLVTVPVEEYYKRRITREEVEPVAIGAIEALVDALITPLAADETDIATEERPAAETIRINAAGYDLALEEFNQLFLDNHWGSGLPLVPPTKERVQWMLSGTSRSPNEVIGIVAPKNGIATLERIAVNSVMAGAKPEYLPVIVTAMEALTDKRFDLLHMTTSTGSFTLQIVVTGPIAEEIGMNAGIGFLGYGWRSNNTIGHAIRLCLINIGMVWPQENDMALMGRPSSHTFQTFAENQAKSPWEPYHVSLGFETGDSCVTVATAMSHNSPGATIVFGGGAVEPWTPQIILDNIVNAIARGRSGMTVWKLGSVIPSPQRHNIFLQPELAIELDRLGYTRKSLMEYLYGRASVPFEDLTPAEKQSVERRIADGEIPQSCVAAFKKGLKPGGRVPVLNSPEDCHIMVAGGAPGYSFGTSYFSIPPYAATSIQTKKIHGATLTRTGK
jgi:hypothetical protein